MKGDQKQCGVARRQISILRTQYGVLKRRVIWAPDDTQIAPLGPMTTSHADSHPIRWLGWSMVPWRSPLSVEPLPPIKWSLGWLGVVWSCRSAGWSHSVTKKGGMVLVALFWLPWRYWLILFWEERGGIHLLLTEIGIGKFQSIQFGQLQSILKFIWINGPLK